MEKHTMSTVPGQVAFEAGLARGKGAGRSTHYIVQTAAACMPSSCWGEYGRVAVIEVEAGLERAAMISPRARGVVRVVRVWDKLNKGTSERCAFARALADARELATQLNAPA